MSKGNKEGGSGCGCALSVIFIIIGFVIMCGWLFNHPNATFKDKFLFHSSVIFVVFMLSVFAVVIDNALFSHSDDSSSNDGDDGVIRFVITPVKGDNTNEPADKKKDKEHPTDLPTLPHRNSKADSVSVSAPVVAQVNDGTLAPSDAHPSQRLYVEEARFLKFKEAREELLAFCNKTAANRDLRETMVNLAAQDGQKLDGSLESVSDLFYELAMKDVLSCMEKMGCGIETLTEKIVTDIIGKPLRSLHMDRMESQMLIGLMMLTLQPTTDYVGFKTTVMSLMNHKTSKIAIASENKLNDYVNSTSGVNSDEVSDYNVALILRAVGMNDEAHKYKRILYSLMRSFAYADESLSPQERDMLRQLGSEAGVVDVGITVDGAPDASVDTLNELIGLNEVKLSITSLVNFISVNQKRRSMGLKVPTVSYHCVFTGNPGTGKTTVARILAGIYKNLGILQTGQLVETDRSGLVAEYVGQTAVKTNAVIDKAIGGMLFVDEAYSLVGGGQEDYGREAISTLLKRMEDDRDKLVVVLAGYSKEMEDFINSNPGLRSRFSRYIHFPDYSAEELYEIFCRNMRKFDYQLDPEADKTLQNYLADRVAHKPKDFGNAREVRNLFEKVVEAQSDRLGRTEKFSREALSLFIIDDIRKAYGG